MRICSGRCLRGECEVRKGHLDGRKGGEHARIERATVCAMFAVILPAICVSMSAADTCVYVNTAEETLATTLRKCHQIMSERPLSSGITIIIRPDPRQDSTKCQ